MAALQQGERERERRQQQQQQQENEEDEDEEELNAARLELGRGLGLQQQVEGRRRGSSAPCGLRLREGLRVPATIDADPAHLERHMLRFLVQVQASLASVYVCNTCIAFVGEAAVQAGRQTHTRS